MDVPLAPTQPIQLRPRFNLSVVLDRIFSNYDVASFLVSKEELPPTSLSSDILGRSMHVTSLLIPVESKGASSLLRSARSRGNERGSQNEGSETREDSSEFNNLSQENQVNEIETIFFVCHGLSEDYCLATATDRRSPLSFLEKPSVPVDALRRTVCMKLKDVGVAEAHVSTSHYWLADGRSSLTVLCYGLEPEPFTEKYFVLFDRYPIYRFPKCSDILETMTGMEQPFCPFCARRGYELCECPRKMVERMRPSIPPRNARNPWQMQRWLWTCYENSVRKYFVCLKHIPSGAEHMTRAFHECTAPVTDNLSLSKGFEYYLNELKPYLTKQLVSRSNVALSYNDGRNQSIVPSIGAHSKNGHSIQELVTKPNATDMTASAVVDGVVAVTTHEVQPVDNERALVQVPGSFDESNKQSHQSPSRSSLKDSDRSAIPISDLGIDTTVNEHAMTIQLSVIQVEGANRLASPVPEAAVPTSTTRKHQERKRKAEAEQDGSEDDQDHIIVEAYLAGIDVMDFPYGSSQQCALCSHRYSRRHDLKRHVLSKHLKERSFHCEVCEAKFTRKRHVAKHIKKFHADPM